MSIVVYNYSVTGDCSNTGSGSIYFDISGTSSPWSVFETAPTTGYFPTSGTTNLYSVGNIPAGEYSITVTDASLDSVTYPIYISSGTCVSSQVQATSCGSDNGSLSASTQYTYGSGGDFYLYDINNNLIDSAIDAGINWTFPFLSAGTYYVIADDGGGCTGRSESCIIKSSVTFNYGAYIVNDASCTSLSGTGKVFITGQTGNPPYTYDWSDGQTGSTATGLTSGVYSVTVTDSSGCANSQNFLVEDVPPPNIVSFTTTSPSCFANDGEVDVLVVGGTAPYYYSGSNGTVGISFSTLFTFTGLSSGVFTVTVTDAGLCTDTDSVSLITPNGFSIVSITTLNSNCNQTDGSVNVVINAGSPGGTYTYTLIDSSGNTVSTNTAGVSYTFPTVSSGLYTVEVSNGTCTYTGTTTVNNTNLYTITANTTGTTCGFNDGTIEIIASSGGTLPYTYQITGQPAGPISTFNGLSQGFYDVLVTDAGGCSQTETVYINGSSAVYFDFFSYSPVVGNDGELDVLISSGEPEFILNWSPNVNGQTGTTVTGLSAGTYSLEVIDNNGCSFTRTITLFGTTQYSSYQTFNVCAQDFTNTGILGRRGILQMMYEGYYDLTSGDTNCILNSAIFTADITVSGVTQQSIFYTSTGFDDIPTDNDWVNAITTLLYTFNGISSVSIDIDTNQVIISSGCIQEGSGCQTKSVTVLDDENVTINLYIDYDISCVSCLLEQKVFQDDFEFVFQDDNSYIFQG
jgi:hypothetical protein